LIVLDRLYEYTGNNEYREQAHIGLEAFSGIASRYGMFASTYGLATVLHARHPLQVVITGAYENEAARQLKRAASLFYRFGKAVLRVTAKPNFEKLPRALRAMLPAIHVKRPQPYVRNARPRCSPCHDHNTHTEILRHMHHGK